MSMVQSSRNLAISLVNINLGGGGATVDLGSILSSNPAVQGTALQILSALKNVQIGIGAFVHPLEYCSNHFAETSWPSWRYYNSQLCLY
jgi:hypothetical protein